MKSKTLKSILQNADLHTTEQIGWNYSATDEAQKQRILRKLRDRRIVNRESKPFTEEVAEQVTNIHRTPWYSYAVTAAAFAAVIGVSAYCVQTLRVMKAEPPVTQPAQTVPVADTLTEAPTEEIIQPETAPAELTKDTLYSHCMSTVRYLHQVSGHIEIWYSQFAFKETADVMMDYDANRFYGMTKQIELSTDRTVSQAESFMSADRSLQFWDIEEWDFTYSDGTSGHSEKSKSTCYEAGVGEIDRGNSTFDWAGLLHGFAQFYSPQDTTRGFLSDQSAWEITGREEYQGRDCAVIEGTSADYGKKFKVTQFQIKVDIATGVWMFFEGYDDEGTCQWYLHTQDVAFDDAAMQVPDISEEEVDQRIADGYILSEQGVQYRQAHLEALAKAAEQPTEETTVYAEPFVMPETMPQPFADGTEPESSWYRPCDDRFDSIPEELSALVPEEDIAEWMTRYPDLKETTVTSLGEYANKYTFIRDFGLTDEQVRTAMQDYIAAWDPEISLRQDEMSAILSGNETAMLNDFALESSMEGTLILGTKFYTPKWIYEHDIEDYQAEGISPELLADTVAHWHFDLTPDAEKALTGKINLYAAMK